MTIIEAINICESASTLEEWKNALKVVSEAWDDFTEEEQDILDEDCFERLQFFITMTEGK